MARIDWKQVERQVQARATTNSPLPYVTNIYPNGATVGAAPTVVVGATYAVAVLNAAGTGFESFAEFAETGGNWRQLPTAGKFTFDFPANGWTVAPTVTTNQGNMAASIGSGINATNTERWQPFNATASGTVSSVQINMGNDTGGAGTTARVRLYAGNGTGGTVLAEAAAVATSGFPTTRTATFAAATTLNSGSTYTVGVVSNTAVGTLIVNSTTIDLFPGFTSSVNTSDIIMGFTVSSGGAASGAPSTLSYPATTHLRGTTPIVQVYSGTGPFTLTTVTTDVNAAGDVTLTIPAGDEFAGRVIII